MTVMPRAAPAILKITSEALTTAESQAGVTRIPPIIGADLPAGRYYELAKPHFDRTDVWLAPSEVGTTLAHLTAYEHIQETQQGAIILEADVTLDTGALTTLRQAVQAYEAPYILLGYYETSAGRARRRVKPHPTGLLVRDIRQRFEGAFAYFVSPPVAHALRSFHVRELRTADAWGEFFTEHDFEPLYLPLVPHGKASGANQAARTTRKSHWNLFRRLAHRTHHYLHLRWHTRTARIRGWRPDPCGTDTFTRTVLTDITQRSN